MNIFYAQATRKAYFSLKRREKYGKIIMRVRIFAPTQSADIRSKSLNRSLTDLRNRRV